MENEIKFGERLTELMITANIKNAELAKAIGVHVTTVQRWKRNAKYLYLSSMIKIADYFHCSLDFLAGRTETVIDYVPRECPPFYERVREVMREKKYSTYRMNQETKIKDSYFVKWKRGTEPHILSLIALAQALDVTIDYLVGREI